MNPLVYILGLLIGIWAFYKSRKKGYIAFIVFFTLAVFSNLATPAINKITAENRKPGIFEKELEKFKKQQAAKRPEISQKQPRKEKLSYRTETIHFPLGPILLVLGLYLLAKSEKQKLPESENKEKLSDS